MKHWTWLAKGHDKNGRAAALSGRAETLDAVCAALVAIEKEDKLVVVATQVKRLSEGT